ncbi:aa3-type cytochrome c oxidase subunit IV [Pseudooceanicola sp. CBS1P-1]|uniref:Aa3-type cytochrome c oxidase subunit IV n=1 Tax=Pseudooceanicola albus TaxID=2692189 RepID=A0A6L7G274_9RHOB|nr:MULTISPECIES: aa3-type cytochrome c oxidase subunit IV [Pseudooceanicola]MBT9384851.1 aa3-type cytochrome c oxidase subunit IV [Pseudooceanicola endophyticus]MXN18155.1 aa3-type cytochrome c oxidase subunit IV [Pseudooceanicola albus]
MARHIHGDMNIEAHERTFEGFVRAAALVAGGAVAILLVLALVNS